jgi:hypothetical protein
MESIQRRVADETQLPFLRGYRVGSAILATYLLALLPLYLIQDYRGTGLSVAVMSAVAAAILLALHLWLRLGNVKPSQASVVATVAMGTLFIRILLHLVVIEDLALTSDLMLLLVGAGIVFPKRSHFYATVAVTLVAWAAAAFILTSGHSVLMLSHWAVGMVSATLVSVTVNSIFVTVLISQQRLRTVGLQNEADKEALIAELNLALDNVRTLRGLLPICASCKQIRDETGAWHALETYVHRHSEARFSHGLCPNCERSTLAAAGLTDADD